MARALAAGNIAAVLTGGSAAELYAPDVYTSLDADFVLDHNDSLGMIEGALSSIGFARMGRARMFAHPESAFTIDFPSGPLAVGGEYVREIASIERDGVELRILSKTDCVRDRLAHYFHWNDYTALKAAVGVAAAHAGDIDMALLERWSLNEDHAAKFREFEARRTAALRRSSARKGYGRAES